MLRAAGETTGHADVSEFRLRKLMQSSASPFVISNAVRDMWLSTGIHPLGGPDRRFRARSELAGVLQSSTQITQSGCLRE
jgi:hypothetical protein